MKSKLACPAPVLPGGRFLFPVLTSESRKSKTHTCVFFFPPCSRWGRSSPPRGGSTERWRRRRPLPHLDFSPLPGSLGSVPGSQLRHSRSLPAFLLLFTLWVQCFQTGPSEHLPKRSCPGPGHEYRDLRWGLGICVYIITSLADCHMP